MLPKQARYQTSPHPVGAFDDALYYIRGAYKNQDVFPITWNEIADIAELLLVSRTPPPRLFSAAHNGVHHDLHKLGRAVEAADLHLRAERLHIVEELGVCLPDLSAFADIGRVDHDTDDVLGLGASLGEQLQLLFQDVLGLIIGCIAK